MNNIKPPEKQRTIVHLVHGTWPYGVLRHLFRIQKASANLVLWFEPESAFCSAVQQAAQRDLEFVSFKWSGKNSFAARNKAAQELREHLKQWLTVPNTNHFIVAHSHGGTVAFQALANYPTSWCNKLLGLYTMATPFVSLCKEAPGAHWRSGVLSIGPIASTSALLAYLSARSVMPDDLVFSFFFYFSLFFFFGAGLFGIFGNFFERDSDQLRALLLPDAVTIPCNITAYRLPGDEATLSIVAAQFIDLLMNKFLSTLILRPLFALFLPFSRLGLWKGFISLSVLLGTIAVIAEWLIASEFHLYYLLYGPLYTYVLAITICACISLAILLFLLPGLACLAVATGPEAIRYVGQTTVSAESIPADVSARLEFIEFDDVEGLESRLRHSLHESKGLRRRLGKQLQHISNCNQQFQ